jgi:hypothetical protein
MRKRFCSFTPVDRRGPRDETTPAGVQGNTLDITANARLAVASFGRQYHRVESARPIFPEPIKISRTETPTVRIRPRR